MPDVTVSSKAPANSPRYAGMSPLQAGLLYGGAASSVMGPFGILVGLGAGVMAKRMRQSEVDRQANFRAEHEELIDQLDSEYKIADPDEQRLIGHARRLANDGWMRLLKGDMSGRDMIAKADDMSMSIMQGDLQARKQKEAATGEFQRGLITTSANDLRQQYLTNMNLYESVDQQAQRVLELVSQPGFDANKPINKAALADMLSVGVNGFYKDAPDVLDAVAQGAGGLGTLIGAAGGVPGALAGGGIGSLVGAITTGIKSKDFKVTAEDYNRIALNMKKFNQQYSTDRMTRLGESANSLDNFARNVGAIGDDYSLSDYVSGGIKDLRLTPSPVYKPPQSTNGPPATSMQRLQQGTNAVKKVIDQWMKAKGFSDSTTGLRPTN